MTGTKVVCAEGDCGSCTIFLGRPAGDKIDYRTACSCIQFLHQLDCTHIVTVEGLKYGDQLNPIQEAMVTCQGSQCGFCTPGFIVSMYAMFEAAAGPLRRADRCRRRAWGIFADARDMNRFSRGNSVESSQVRPLTQLYSDETMFAELRDRTGDSVRVEDGAKSFFKPATIEEACQFRRDNPGCTIISGGTDIGVQINKSICNPKVFLSLSGLTELRQIRVQDGAIIAGT